MGRCRYALGIQDYSGVTGQHLYETGARVRSVAVENFQTGDGRGRGRGQSRGGGQKVRTKIISKGGPAVSNLKEIKLIFEIPI